MTEHEKKSAKHNLNIIGRTVLGQHCLLAGGDIGAPIFTSVTVRGDSPVFKPIAYKMSVTNRKRKYFEEKTTATLKSKRIDRHNTSHGFPTPLIFHWSLYL